MNTDRKKLRQTGFGLAGIYIFFLAILGYKNPHSVLFPIFLFLLCIHLIQFIFFTKTLAYTEKILIKTGFVLGWINTRIILTVLFYFMIVPLSFLMKRFKNETLDIHLDKLKESYWEDYQNPKPGTDTHLRQF